MKIHKITESNTNGEINIIDAERIKNDIVEQSLIVVSENEKCTVYMELVCDANTEEIIILRSCNYPYHKDCFKIWINLMNKDNRIYICSTWHYKL